MTVTLTPVSPAGGVEVGEVDARALASDEADVLRRAWRDHHFILLRDQALDVEQQLAFASYFGVIRTPSREIHQHLTGTDTRFTYLSNTRPDGTGGGNAELFPHQDYSFADPVGGICLHAIELPSAGGDTGFTNCQLALEELPASLRCRIEGRSAQHFERFARLDPPSRAVHPIVYTHPETGRELLFVNPVFTEFVVGLDPGESESLLSDLYDWLARPEFTYWHRWRVGDLLLFDNTVLQHARTSWPNDEARTLRRCQLDFFSTAATARSRIVPPTSSSPPPPNFE